MSYDYTSAAKEEILHILNFDDTNPEAQKEKDKILRKLKKWENTTKGGLNFIAADVAGVMAALSDEKDFSLVGLPLFVRFSDSYYTVLSTEPSAETPSARVSVLAPNKVSATQFVNYLDLLLRKGQLEGILQKDASQSSAALQLASIKADLAALPPVAALQQTVYQQTEENLTKCFTDLGIVPANDRSLRIATVGEQAAIEEKIIASDEAAVAVFFVPTPLTPFYIPQDKIFFDPTDQLYKTTAPELIPQGVMPEEKLKDPAQLSTLLRRVKTLHDMLEKGMKIIVLCGNLARPNLSDKTLLVDDQHLRAVQEKYPEQLILRTLAEIPKDIHAANYFLASGEIISISAAQMGQSTPASVWGVHAKAPDYQAVINAQLHSTGVAPVDKLLLEKVCSAPVARPG